MWGPTMETILSFFLRKDERQSCLILNIYKQFFVRILNLRFLI